MVGDEIRSSRECCAQAAKEAVEAYKTVRDSIDAREKERLIRCNYQERITELWHEFWIFALFGVSGVLYSWIDWDHLSHRVWFILVFSLMCFVIVITRYVTIKLFKAKLK